MAIFIYGLVCPVENTVRYVGKAVRPEQRLACHISGARRFAYDHHTARWIRRLLADGLAPQLIILHEVQAGERWQDVEREFIASAADRGWRLTNSTAGGEGLDYIDPEDEARYRANLKRAMSAYLATPEGQAKFRRMIAATLEPVALARRNEAIRASGSRPEFKEKMRGVGSEIGSRPEVKDAKSRASKAMWRDPETRARFMAGNATPEKKAKLSERKKASWADPEVGAKLRAIHSSEEVRQKKSEGAKRRSTPEYRAMMAAKTKASWEARRNRS
jgi:hypothetical protein